MFFKDSVSNWRGERGSSSGRVRVRVGRMWDIVFEKGWRWI